MTRPGQPPSSDSSDRTADDHTGIDGRRRGGSGLIFRAWNLLLLVPLLMLITPWFNRDAPRLFGLPFFYWYQLAFVFVGVACVSIVYAATKRHPASKQPRTAPPDETRRVGTGR